MKKQLYSITDAATFKFDADLHLGLWDKHMPALSTCCQSRSRLYFLNSIKANCMTVISARNEPAGINLCAMAYTPRFRAIPNRHWQFDQLYTLDEHSPAR